MTQIIPAPLATTEEQYQEMISQIAQCDLLQDGWVQIDIADNTFVPSQTVGIETIEKYPISLQKEAHLMVNNPVVLLPDLKRLGFKRVLIHYEIENWEAALKEAKEQGFEVGIALNPETAVSTVEPFLDTMNVVQIMSVRPGFQGQTFIPESIEKIKELSELRSKTNSNFLIAVDGGLNPENVKEVVDAGADNLLIGSALLKGDIDENLEQIWEALH